MGKYCDICKKKDVDIAYQKIDELVTKEYINGKWYSGHRGMVCEKCREQILCSLDKLPSDLKQLDESN